MDRRRPVALPERRAARPRRASLPHPRPGPARSRSRGVPARRAGAPPRGQCRDWSRSQGPPGVHLARPPDYAAVNFVEDVLESFPASKPALVTIAHYGERRVWHFGELIARSGGLSGAFAARGVNRGDIVMTLVGSRVEWVLAMLACWRMGAIAMPCNTQLRRGDLETRIQVANPVLCVGEDKPLGELSDGVPFMTMEDVAAVMDEERPQEPPAEVAGLDPEDGALVIFTSGTTGEPRGALHAQRYLPGQRT